MERVTAPTVAQSHVLVGPVYRFFSQHWALVIGSVYFLAGGLYQIELPGLYADEALQAAPAARIAEGLLGTTRLPGSSDVVLFGRAWPTFVMPYIGPVKTYLLAVSFWLFGTSVAVLRITTLLASLIGIIFAYLFLRRLFGQRAANIGALLLASDSSLMLFSRADWGPIAIGFALKMAGLYVLVRWWQLPERLLMAALAGLILGTGVLHKADFTWFILALLPAAMFCLWQRRATLLNLLPGFAALLSGFFVGSLPLWALNIRNNWITWAEPRAALSATLSTQFPGLPLPLALVELARSVLGNRFALLKTVVDGSSFPGWTAGDQAVTLSGIHWNLAIAMLGISVAVIVIASVVKTPTRRAAGPALAFTVAGVLIFGEILVTPDATGPHHSISLYPFPQFVAALGLAILSESRCSRQWLGRGFVGLLVAAFVVVNAIQLSTYYRTLEQNGGQGYWSDGIYRLASTLETRFPTEAVVTTDWGQHDQLIVLLTDKTRVSFWPRSANPEADFRAELERGKRIFVLAAEQFSVFKRQRDTLIGLLEDPASVSVDWVTIRDRSGRPVLLLADVTPRQDSLSKSFVASR